MHLYGPERTQLRDTSTPPHINATFIIPNRNSVRTDTDCPLPARLVSVGLSWPRGTPGSGTRKDMSCFWNQCKLALWHRCNRGELKSGCPSQNGAPQVLRSCYSIPAHPSHYQGTWAHEEHWSQPGAGLNGYLAPTPNSLTSSQGPIGPRSQKQMPQPGTPPTAHKQGQAGAQGTTRSLASGHVGPGASSPPGAARKLVEDSPSTWAPGPPTQQPCSWLPADTDQGLTRLMCRALDAGCPKLLAVQGLTSVSAGQVGSTGAPGKPGHCALARGGREEASAGSVWQRRVLRGCRPLHA